MYTCTSKINKFNLFENSSSLELLRFYRPFNKLGGLIRLHRPFSNLVGLIRLHRPFSDLVGLKFSNLDFIDHLVTSSHSDSIDHIGTGRGSFRQSRRKLLG